MAASLDTDEITRIARLYYARLEEHGMNVGALKSGGATKQWVRHSVHAQAFDLAGRHVVDVGCGIAMFYKFLLGRGVQPASYTGIDIVKPFLEANRKEHPEARFFSLDIFADSLDGLDMDVAFMSQVFNNVYENADNEAVVRVAIQRFFAVARQGIVIDFMSTYVDWKDRDLHYFDPSAMFAFAKSLTRFVEIRHDYLPFEFTLILRKQPAFAPSDKDTAARSYLPRV
ncbi:methyltransferase domain-containing protein [Bradyrhizobium sp. TZ2]